MASELVQLIRKGRAAAFHDEVSQLLEAGEELSLEGETFRGLNLQGFRFLGVDMTNVEFDGCTLTEILFEDCILEGTFITGSTLFDCVLVECKGEGFSMEGCTVGRCKFQDMTLEGAEWTDTQLNDCVFDRLGFAEPLLERLTFKEGTFKSFKANEGTLTHVTLRDTNGNKNFVLTECEANHCYVAHEDTNVTLPEGFARKSGRRRTL
jgi:uncharacterized protein YjbI with pentapeptide repeats